MEFLSGSVLARVMLQKLSVQIRMCDERAAEAKRKVEASVSAALKANYLVAVDRWMALARSYEFTDTVKDFAAAMSVREKRPDELARPDALLLQEISTSLIQDGDIMRCACLMCLPDEGRASLTALAPKQRGGTVSKNCVWSRLSTDSGLRHWIDAGLKARSPWKQCGNKRRWTVVRSWTANSALSVAAVGM